VKIVQEFEVLGPSVISLSERSLTTEETPVPTSAPCHATT
jgi:hypothetical protein